jgi:hypothetical protein
MLLYHLVITGFDCRQARILTYGYNVSVVLQKVDNGLPRHSWADKDDAAKFFPPGTTLLQRLLRDPALSDTAVLINEFGEIGLDDHLLEHIDEGMVMLQSGCVCCTIRGALSTAMKDLHSRREQGLLPVWRRRGIGRHGPMRTGARAWHSLPAVSIRR